MIKLAEAFGFQLSRSSGSHHIFVHPQVKELLNLQDVRGKAKPYRIGHSEVEAAKELWLNAARAEGKSIPEPSYRPAIYRLAS